MKEKFDMFNLVNYFRELDKPTFYALLEWYSDKPKIEIPFTGDFEKPYTEGNLFIDRKALLDHLGEFLAYDYSSEETPMGLSHMMTLKVLDHLDTIHTFEYNFERGFKNYGDLEG